MLSKATKSIRFSGSWSYNKHHLSFGACRVRSGKHTYPLGGKKGILKLRWLIFNSSDLKKSMRNSKTVQYCMYTNRKTNSKAYFYCLAHKWISFPRFRAFFKIGFKHLLGFNYLNLFCIWHLKVVNFIYEKMILFCLESWNFKARYLLGDVFSRWHLCEQ